MNISEVTFQLKGLEPVFHTEGTYPTADCVQSLLSPEFCEVGGSGRRYMRAEVVQMLAERTSAGVFELMEAQDFCCTQISAGSYLATYLLQQKDRLTRRSSIWCFAEGTWRILYHQGTVVQ